MRSRPTGQGEDVPCLVFGDARVFGLKIEFLPDFLMDHTLLGDQDEQRLREHCRRWSHFVGGLWTSDDCERAYALRFISSPDVGEVRIRFLVRVADTDSVSGIANDVMRALRSFDVESALIQPEELAGALEVSGDHVIELRQREDLVPFKEMGGFTAESEEVYSVTPWWGPGGPFLAPFETMVTQNVPITVNILLTPGSLVQAERDHMAEHAVKGTTASNTTVTTDLGGKMESHSADPQAEWVGRLFAANLRRLQRPFLVQVHCVSEEPIAARSIAGALVSTINEESPYEIPLGEPSNLQSQAEMVALHPDEAIEAMRCLQQLQFHYSRITKSENAQDPAAVRRLRYLVDARGASTVFRFPVSVRGGVPGIKVMQQPPDFHPGARASEMPAGHISLGRFHSGGEASVAVSDFTKHCLVTGFTGSGKTMTVLHLLHQFWNEFGIPFLVVESAKREYRGVLRVKSWKEPEKLRVYTLGDETGVPFRLNPFELIEGVRLETHVGRLLTCFEAALPQFGVLPSIIAEAIERIYRATGWRSLTAVGPPAHTPCCFPTLADLYDVIDDVVAKRKYKGELATNLPAAAKGRIQPLLMGSKGKMFGTQRSIPAESLFEQPAILELNDLNEQDKALVAMFLLTLLREYRETHLSETGDLLHVTVVEEAHNVLERTVSRGDQEVGTDSKAKAVQAFCNMLSEVRAYGEGMIIADQSPEKLARDAMRNTNVQIAHQLRDANDRDAVANAMIMTNEQRDYLGKLAPGRAAVFFTGLERATFVQFPRYYLRARERAMPGERDLLGEGFGAVSNEELRDRMVHAIAQLRQLENAPRFCPACQGPCRFPDSVAKILADPQLSEAAAETIRTIRDKQTRPPVPEVWKRLAELTNRAANLAGHPGDPDFAWCCLNRIWDRHETSRLGPSNRRQLIEALGAEYQ